MLKNSLVAGLLGVLLYGCAAKEDVHEPYADVRVPVRLISYSPHALRWKAPESANVANDGMHGAVSLWPITLENKIVWPDYKGHYGRIKACPGELCIYILKTISYEDKKGNTIQADGLYIKYSDPCDGFIIMTMDGAHDDTLLHEIGHAFGLEHGSDPDNVMTVDRNWDARLTNSQLNIMRYHALRWREHCLSD